MRFDRKQPKSDLRKYYTVFLEGSLIIVLLIFLAVTNIDFQTGENELNLSQEQEMVKMEKIVQTKHIETPPPPPRPPVPVTVPNDEVIEDQIVNINAELNLDQKLEIPAPPPKVKEVEEEDFFIVVEQMPEIKGGLASIQRCVNYPKMAQKAGVEGRVIVQFIVNEQGSVNDPTVVRGIGAGADEEAIRCVQSAEFTPGQQRGEPVRVQFSVPVVYNLTN